MSEPPSDPNEPETPRREFRFKPTEFERANRPLDEADDTPAVDLRALYRQANLPPASVIKPAAPAENDVHAILRANLAEADEAGLNDLILKPKHMSRRNRDYWTLLVLGDAFFGVLMFTFGWKEVGGLCCLAGAVVYSIGLTWIMRFVMSDY